MIELARQIGNRGQSSRRIMAGTMAVGSGSLFTLAAIAFLASFSPFTFLPFLAAAIILALLGALFIAFPPLLEFFW